MARKFLYIFAALIVLVLIGAFTYRLFGVQMMRAAMVPTSQFVAPAKAQPRGYADAALWFARPDIAESPVSWVPKGVASVEEQGNAAIFFIHPTSYITMKRDAQWNAALDDKETNVRAGIFVRGQASVFNAAGELWVPRYRQANFGAFLTDKPEGLMALNAAYLDVATAFDHFVRSIPRDKPVILAGHSQGALHLTRLLKDKVAGAPLARRLVAAYVVGWPVSVETDMQAMGFPACSEAEQTGCIASWLSFAEPADTSLIELAFDATTGFDRRPRKDTAMLCFNPLTGTERGEASASANLGTLKNKPDFSDGELVPGAVPARCNERGFLLIGEGPELGPYLLPGNNYHVYDYSLFWANLRADAMRRLAAFEGR